MNNKPAHSHVEPSRGWLEKDSAFGRFWRWLISVLWMIWEWMNGQKSDEHALQYFLPGQMVYYVKHDAGLTDDQIINIFEWSQTEWLEETQKQITISLRRSLSFTGFTLIFADVQNVNDLETLILFLNDKLTTSSPFPGLTLELSPNWLIGSAKHGPHPPSPGSWPIEAPAPNQDERKFWLIKDEQDKPPLRLPFDTEKGTGIDVAILDTAPSKINRDEAYETWKSDPLIGKLLDPNGKLKVHPGIYADVEAMDYSVAGHRYLMPDHGLFIAGIIHSIAPEANLHLFKAFTSYGSASTETIAQGITQILQMFRKEEDKNNWRPLIVNCSFGLSIDESSHVRKEIQKLITFFQEMFNQLIEKDVMVVAAAGNDANEKGREKTRYPARFKKVLGVGALPKVSSISQSDYKAATYSNLCDNEEPDEGYMVFGGEPGSGQGVRGIYTSEFPVYAPIYAQGCLWFLWRLFTGTGLNGWKGPGHLPPNPESLTIDQIRYKPNKTGWAWWAGTSFATPIVTGLLATGVSLKGMDPKGILGGFIQNKKRTPEGETVIVVTQGPPPP